MRLEAQAPRLAAGNWAKGPRDYVTQEALGCGDIAKPQRQLSGSEMEIVGLMIVFVVRKLARLIQQSRCDGIVTHPGLGPGKFG